MTTVYTAQTVERSAPSWSEKALISVAAARHIGGGATSPVTTTHSTSASATKSTSDLTQERDERCLRTVGADEPEQAVRAARGRACGEAAVGIVEAAAPQAEEARRPRIDHHQRLRTRASRHQFVVDS